MAIDPWTPVDDPASRVKKAIPGARITSERRDPAHNAAVGGAPNSAHLKGFATDFVPPVGSDPAAVEAGLRKQGKFDQIIYEGDHVHYSDDPRGRGQVFGAQGAQAPDPWTPVKADPWAPVATKAAATPAPAKAPQPPVAQLKPATASGWDPVGYLKDTAGRVVADAAHNVAQDVREDLAAQKTPPGVGDSIMHPLAAGGIARAPKEVWDVIQTAMSPLTGAYDAAIARPLGELEHKIPLGGGRRIPVKEGESDAITALSGLGAEGGAMRAAELSAPRVPKARIPELPAPAGKVVGTEIDPAERVDNALFRNGGHATEDKIKALQSVKDLPKHLKDPKVQARALEEVEHKGLVDPKAKLSPETQELEAIRKPWADEQREGINEIRKRLAEKGHSEAEIEEYAPDSGYVPRRVEGKAPGFDPADPDAAGRDPLRITGGRSLSKQTGSMRERTQIVLEDANGQRRIEHRNKTNEEWKPGMQVRDPLTGKPTTVKQATVKEIEGAGARDSKGNLLTYHKNPLANTIDEALKVKRVLRNMDVLDEITKSMQSQGLAHHVEWHYPAGDAGNGPPEGSRIWARARNPKPTPQGFQELPHIPQLKGWAFDPKVAEVLKDYYPPKGRFDALDESFAVVNRALNASLFATPFPHLKNVGTMGFIGRGWDNLPTVGNVGRLIRTGREAAKEVLTLGPKYREFLREGASLRAGDEATRNFHQKLLDMTSEQLAKDPRAAKAMGFASPVEAAKALYSASHKFLWNGNDMVMFQRYLELKEKGMSNRQAIKETERWIANYRIPSRVLGKRWTAELFKNSNVLNFGHYGYGKFRAIGEMIKGLTQGTKEEKLDAAGKVAMIGVLGLIIHPLLTAIARQVTGNKNAKVDGGGEMSVIENITDPEKNWTQKAASIVEPAPLIDAEAESPVLGGNRNIFTGKPTVEPGSTPLGQAVQGGEWLAGKFYPAQLGLEAMKPGGAEQALGQLTGISLPPERSAIGKAKGKAYDRSRAKSREKKDEIENMIRERLQ